VINPVQMSFFLFAFFFFFFFFFFLFFFSLFTYLFRHGAESFLRN